MSLRETGSKDLLALTAGLVAIPSESRDEKQIADEIEDYLTHLAPDLTLNRVQNSLVARTNRGLEQRVVLAGHVDTVPANGNAVPKVEGNVVRGLGAADMKSGIAVMLALTEQAQRASRDLTFIFYEREEIADEHNGLRRLFAEKPELCQGEFAILLEPTGGAMEVGCQGIITARVSYTGRRAHSARPWLGDNAIHKLAPAIYKIAEHADKNVMVDGLEYREAAQVVGIEGGIAHNVIPDAATLVLNRRFAPGKSVEEATQEIRAWFSDADDFEILNASPAAPPHLETAAIAEFAGTLDLLVKPKLGWTDVARFTEHGIPAVNFGPGGPQLAHTAEEEVNRVDVEGCYRVLAHFLGYETVGLGNAH